jgi:hypothetical protein
LKEKNFADFHDTEIKNNFNEFKNDLIHIKSTYDNKRKYSAVKASLEECGENNQKSVEENPSKQKKKVNKKSRVMIDTSEIAKKIKEDSERFENEAILDKTDNKTPVKEERPSSPIPSIKAEKCSDSSKKTPHAITNSDKKNKLEKVKFKFLFIFNLIIFLE